MNKWTNEWMSELMNKFKASPNFVNYVPFFEEAGQV